MAHSQAVWVLSTLSADSQSCVVNGVFSTKKEALAIAGDKDVAVMMLIDVDYTTVTLFQVATLANPETRWAAQS